MSMEISTSAEAAHSLPRRLLTRLLAVIGASAVISFAPSPWSPLYHESAAIASHKIFRSTTNAQRVNIPPVEHGEGASHQSDVPDDFLSAVGRSLPTANSDNGGLVASVPETPNKLPGLDLNYAQPEPGSIPNIIDQRLLPSLSESHTAVYDISNHTVYMPDGEILEAHSGLGDRLDDPDHVMEKNRGPTPPHVYNLELRESLFHGVQALRLIPIGDGKMFGRTGLLAHTYMRGLDGESNGCIAFKDYDKFLQSFLMGEVTHIDVVSRLIQDDGSAVLPQRLAGIPAAP